ncbi:MAG TPA: TIGR01777 family oxidoreductase [Candidatus Sulfotelmatobacter sp.]|nr:TIGR01777 family oxidoreductase [Candidatus Sulfotelmatobacter sp.]
MISRVLVSGVSGPIGAALVPSLESRGMAITRLTRAGSLPSPASAIEVIPWDPAKPISPEAVSGFDAVIHLAGETIVGRWTAAKKTRIRDSRVIGTSNLAQALARAKLKPQVFVCSSAIGYYGDRGGEVLGEQSAPGTGFLADVCCEWEAATRPAAEAGIRTVQIRTGVVLSPRGGALGKMLTPFKLGLGGRLGDGRQWMSWIDIQDMVGAIHHILKTDLLHGPVNMVAPKAVMNVEFTKTLASVLSRPAVFPVPAFAVKLAFGEMGETVLLAGQRVEPSRLVASGYPFRFRELQASLKNLLNR